MAEADIPTTPSDEDNEYPATPRDDPKKASEKAPGIPERGAIYVEDSAAATLQYSETLISYGTTREAINASLALPAEIKKNALITTHANGGRYHGWEIYRLWGR
jgi:hypothetical protein